MKKIVITLIKITLSLVIIGYLFWASVRGEDNRKAFFAMLAQPKRWDWIIASYVFAMVAVIITMIRWCYLIRAMGIHFPMRDAIRVGFLGYLFNLAPMGIVGGDLLKAVMLSRERPGNRAKAFASVVVDRIVGLYVLFLVSVAGIFLTGYWNFPDRNLHAICVGVVLITIVSTIGIAVVLVPGVLESRWVVSMTRLPKVGHAIEGLLEALRMYRSDRQVLLVTGVMTLPVHILLTVSVCSFARGLQFNTVPWTDFFAIYPVSGIASTIPLPAGPMEFGIVFFYAAAVLQISRTVTAAVAHQQGLIIALGYRLVTVLIAPVGVIYYILGRGEVSDVMQHPEEPDGPESPVIA